jgi:hypothetical protein
LKNLHHINGWGAALKGLAISSSAASVIMIMYNINIIKVLEKVKGGLKKV